MKTPSFHRFMDVFKMWLKLKSNGNQDTRRSDTELKHLTYSNMKTTTLLVISLFINGVVTDEVKSVMVGDSVTLQTDLTKLQRDDLIDWRFGDQKDLIAKLNKEANTSKLFNGTDGRFRGRLKINTETGDLTITDITTQHTGLYQVEVNGERITTKTFNISVSVDVNNVKVNDEEQSSGLSSGVVAGLCVFLLVLVFALALAIFLYRRLSRSTGNNRADINEEETGKESAEMKKPFRTESNSSDLS